MRAKLTAKEQRRLKKEKKRKRAEASFKDYFDYSESLQRVPPHRILAINRGERSRILQVKVEVDIERAHSEVQKLVPLEEHPFGDFLRDCLRDALTRLLVPSIEREVRGELAERAEKHAIQVFVQNLRKLLLQPPVHGQRVLAADPGYRSGCRLVALDEFGNMLDHTTIALVGNAKQKTAGRAALVAMLKQHRSTVVAIGNGTACRETEQLVAGIISSEFKDAGISYAVVNKAGTSVYSTSSTGREELPECDAELRSVIAIGRRLLDPLSEFVKISPTNIDVGMYQHDIKAKQLRESLEAVVESCVNYVGVNVNTANPALLGRVSGLKPTHGA